MIMQRGMACPDQWAMHIIAELEETAKRPVIPKKTQAYETGRQGRK